MNDLIEKEKLHDALRQMGTKYLKPPWRKEWSKERPTTGYCYVVSEVIYHYLAPKGSRPFVIKNENYNHWFIRDPDGSPIDQTADQFDEPVDYTLGKPHNFRTKPISNRGRVLAELLGLKKDE
jgi:hypothetical protein